MDKVLVLGARKWRIDEDGKAFEGVTVEFVETYVEASPTHHGISPQKVRANDAIFDALAGKAPCFAEVRFGRRPGKGGKSETTLDQVKVLKPFDLAAVAG